MKFELTPYKYNVPENILLSDLKDVAKKLKLSFLPKSEYDLYGNFCSATFLKRFGSWHNALKEAGLEFSPMYREKISDEGYFKNIEIAWRSLGKQPSCKQMIKPLSKYSVAAYSKRFGTWRRALEAFVKYINKGESNDFQDNQGVTQIKKRSRSISWRTRFLIMRRDGFRCKICGNVQDVSKGITLHIDHIVPYSKGGETVFDNLQTLCSKCNIGKGDLQIIEGN